MDFKQAGEKFTYLKAGFEAGIFSESEFKSKLEDLMVRDEQGQWWMIGYETERWYRYDGANWVQADPPGSASPAVAPVMAPPPSTRIARVQEPIQAPSPVPATLAPGALSLKRAAAAGPFPRTAPAAKEKPNEAAAGTSGLRPSWSAALWIALAWFISGLLINALYGGLIATTLGNLLGGLLMGLVLRWQGVLRGWMPLLWLSLASVPASFITTYFYLPLGLGFLLGGAFFGVLASLALRSDGFRLDKTAMSRIIVSGALGWWVSWLVSYMLGSSILGGALGGLAAGLVLVWALRGASRQPTSP
jgi:hypothetical protein